MLDLTGLDCLPRISARGMVTLCRDRDTLALVQH